MRWIWMSTNVVVLFAAVSAHAGLFSKKSTCGENCGRSCQPTIVRPCRPNVLCYQRKCSVVKAPCCPCTGAFPAARCNVDGCGQSCETECGASMSCSQGDLCLPDESQSKPCCKSSCTNENCSNCEERREVACLIHQSMTACYARQRRNAVHHLSDYYDTCCHPEIMDALVYALNDCDERVRAKAADEIGDQIRRRKCCFGPNVVCALKYSLGDCDSTVRRQAEEALQLCGYKIVDGCCDGCCVSHHHLQLPTSSAGENSGQLAPVRESEDDAPEPIPVPEPEPPAPPVDKPMPMQLPTEEPARAPAAEPVPVTQTNYNQTGYFPARLHQEYNRPKSRGLANLLGLGH